MSPPRLTRNDILKVIVAVVAIGVIGCDPGPGETLESALVTQCTTTSPCEDDIGVRYYEGNECRPRAVGALCSRAHAGYFWNTVTLPPDYRRLGCVCREDRAIRTSRRDHFIATLQGCGFSDRELGLGPGDVSASASGPPSRLTATQAEWFERARSCLQDYVDRASDGQ